MWVKDESYCPTRTFKDRLAWKYVEAAIAGRLPCGSKTVLGSITLGNTMRSFARAVAHGMSPKQRPKLFAIFPSDFSTRKMGPDSKSKTCLGSEILDNLTANGVRCIEYPLDQGFLSDAELDVLACKHFGSSARLFNATNGIGIPAYKQILIEALDKMPTPPDCIVVPVGAGVLFMEWVEVIRERNLKTRVVGVAVTRSDSIADKIYGLYSPFYLDLFHKGIVTYQDDSRFIVQRIADEQIKAVTTHSLPQGFENAEPSSWAVLVPLLESSAPSPSIRGVVLVVNTGDGIPSTLDSGP
ncbi:MAG: PLP-dependent lyase/thiolase [Verrucomicrobiales bacterium]|nr:PLP-dependent lyase/thiolase [Verrucomicrobiales bacterium]